MKMVCISSALLLTSCLLHGCVTRSHNDTSKLKVREGLEIDETQNRKFENVGFFLGIRECTATAIHPKFVITANHCVNSKEQDQNGFTAFINGEWHQVQAEKVFLIGKPYDESKNLDEDIALVKLSYELPLKAIHPLDTVEPKVGDKAMVLGYGLDGRRELSDPILRAGKLVFVGRAPTDNTIPKSLDVYSSEKGSKYLPCAGDSGGPLFVERNGKQFLAATTVASDASTKADAKTDVEKCNAGTISLHMPVRKHLDWIQRTIEKNK